MVWIQRRKLLASCLCITASVFLLVTLQVVVELGKLERKKFKNSNGQDGHAMMEEEPTHLYPFPGKEALNWKNKSETDNYPIMLWWSPLTGETGRLGQCGADACFFTINRTYLHHHMTKAFLFYGTLVVGLIQHLVMSESVRTRDLRLEQDSYYLADAEQKHGSERVRTFLDSFKTVPLDSPVANDCKAPGFSGTGVFEP
ncbi:alpha-(1,3)-fucosyltransferase 10-like [Lynx rufus]|uniref:alpha-(1,3)-fucosyltransferase 10-like n=1 Tax=Lynx rufus TaxID=61384 RepID=UPI001F125136|nr:alpha-(1,3)-fucosyltransferase 10-like [Lynx rufus]